MENLDKEKLKTQRQIASSRAKAIVGAVGCICVALGAILLANPSIYWGFIAVAIVVGEV